MLIDRWRSAREAGLMGKLRCKADQWGLKALRILFKFDPWHSSAPYSCRPYKKLVVDLVNQLAPSTVVEIGCGLGDVISRVDALERIGIDADRHVIQAAKFLHSGAVRWVHGVAGAVEIPVSGGRPIDCLIMVNWIHGLDSAKLAGLMLPLLPRTRYLVVDAIDAGGPESYRNKHDFAFLAGVAQKVRSIHVPHEPRSLLVFEVKPL